MSRSSPSAPRIRRGKIRILIDDGSGNPVPVGPIQLSTADTVEELQGRVYAWLQQNEPKIASGWPHGVVCLGNKKKGAWSLRLKLGGEAVQKTSQLFEAKPGQISMGPQVKEVIHSCSLTLGPTSTTADGRRSGGRSRGNLRVVGRRVFQRESEASRSSRVIAHTVLRSYEREFHQTFGALFHLDVLYSLLKMCAGHVKSRPSSHDAPMLCSFVGGIAL